MMENYKIGDELKSILPHPQNKQDSLFQICCKLSIENGMLQMEANFGTKH